MIPYEECIDCVAIKFCKIYNNEVKKPFLSKSCNVKFRLYKALELSCIPPEYINSNIYNSKIDDYNNENYKKLSLYVDNILKFVKEGNNGFFYGSMSGTGKTYAGAVLLNHFIYKQCLTDLFDFENPLALFVDYVELMDDLRYSSDNDKLEYKVNKIKNVPFLMLDDVGAGTMSDFVREQTYIIINYRFNHKLSTLITTNYLISDLASDNLLGKRIVSRILNRCIGMEFKGKDRRIVK